MWFGGETRLGAVTGQYNRQAQIGFQVIFSSMTSFWAGYGADLAAETLILQAPLVDAALIYRPEIAHDPDTRDQVTLPLERVVAIDDNL